MSSKTYGGGSYGGGGYTGGYGGGRNDAYAEDSEGSSVPIYVIAPVVIVVFLLILLAGFCAWRRRQLRQQHQFVTQPITMTAVPHAQAQPMGYGAGHPYPATQYPHQPQHPGYAGPGMAPGYPAGPPPPAGYGAAMPPQPMAYGVPPPGYPPAAAAQPYPPQQQQYPTIK